MVNDICCVTFHSYMSCYIHIQNIHSFICEYMYVEETYFYTKEIINEINVLKFFKFSQNVSALRTSLSLIETRPRNL